jgi:hypothetical protein
LRPKIDRFLFEKRKTFFFQFFHLNKWSTYFTSFSAIPSTSNSNTMWNYGEFLFKMGYKFIFLVKFEEARTTQGLKGRVPIKKFVLSIESWNFFSIFVFAHGIAWCHLRYDRSNMNMGYLNFFSKIYTFHGVGVLSQDPRQQKKILLHSYLQI